MSVDIVRAWQAKINKAYESPLLVRFAKELKGQYRRFSSGILSLDSALGGGWPFGRCNLIVGEYSSGKTALAIKACVAIKDYDRKTHLHRSLVPADEFEPCRALIVDAEKSFDIEWAAKLGFDIDHHMVVIPESAEMAIDVITDAIDNNIFDLIILDSIAQMQPSKEYDDSAEDQQMGLAARLCNKAFRKWNTALCRAANKSKVGGPCLIALNQFRESIGFSMGDSRVIPGGKQQVYCSSIIVYTKTGQVTDDKTKDHGLGLFGGYTKKNKTYTQRINYKYKMAIKDLPDRGMNAGDIDNEAQLKALGKATNLITKDKTKFLYKGEIFPSLTKLMEEIPQDDLWLSVVEEKTGYRETGEIELDFEYQPEEEIDCENEEEVTVESS